MNPTIQEKLLESIDKLLEFVDASAKEDMIPRRQADDIFNGLLDARHAATSAAAPERLTKKGVAA